MPKLPPPKVGYQIYNEDCFETFRRIAPGSIDLVLVDPPYGTTQNKWDSVIDLASIWRTVPLLSRGALVFTAAQPFTTVLIASQRKLRYCWVWNKINRLTGFLDSKKKPLKITEDIVVFYERQPVYNPQMTEGEPYKATSRGAKSANYSSQTDGITTVSDGSRYPQNLIHIKADERGTVGRVHPTQKPVALMEYLIKTYSNEGDTVLDFAMGSGTTGIACGNLGRNFIGCDNDTEHGYFEIAKRRIEEAYSRYA